MKKVRISLIAMSLILTLTLPVLAEESSCLFEENGYTNPFINPERSGCCSWHGGVCGCTSSGRAICCDGTLSPSCGC